MNFSILKSTDPYLNLAIEEYLLKNSEEEYFLLWQNEPTVVIGKNQNAFAEINFDYINEYGIHVARRITGGGAVYHDLGNLNYSYISKKQDNDINFERFAKPVIDALCDMGIPATLSGRNDILVEGKKISGNAQTHFGNRTLHHGTLLFDVEMDSLSSALKVDSKKIESKAIKSVRSRVANIKSYLKENISITDFANLIKTMIIDKYSAAEIDIKITDSINKLAERNASDAWLYPDRDYVSRFSLNKKERFDFGTVSVFLNMKNNVITEIKIAGDFFSSSAITHLENLISGVSVSNLEERISNIKVSDYIFGMSNSDFLKMIKT